MSYYEHVQRVYAEKSYKFFDTGNFNLNIFGIRSWDSRSDKFDDKIGVAFKNNGNPTVQLFDATTDPGKHWLQRPMRTDGTIIMVPHQTIGAYKWGYHKSYPALEQKEPMLYVRDNNRDSKLDFELFNKPELYEWSLAKTNLHRASKWKTVLNIGLYSAGCQVILRPEDWELLTHYVKIALSDYSYPNSFTYTLFNEADFQ